MTSVLDIKNDGNGIFAAAINNSDNVHNFVLAANTAEDITVPADSDIAVFSADGDFFMNFNGETAVVPAADITDGLGHILNPAVRQVTPSDVLSVISVDVRQISVEWFKSKGTIT